MPGELVTERFLDAFGKEGGPSYSLVVSRTSVPKLPDPGWAASMPAVRAPVRTRGGGRAGRQL